VTGDANTLDALYRRHAPSVFRRALRILGNPADAHEVVQDVFLSLFERPEQYQAKSALTTFLYSATTHAALNRIRNQKNRLRLLSDQLPGEPMDRSTHTNPERLLELQGLLGRLPEPLGAVAVHYYLDELSHDEIARILGCSRRHVGHLLERLTAWVRAEEKEESC
jgi:RNA polymerase sigma-70 factor (ECF subfamily)